MLVLDGWLGPATSAHRLAGVTRSDSVSHITGRSAPKVLQTYLGTYLKKRIQLSGNVSPKCFLGHCASKLFSIAPQSRGRKDRDSMRSQ